jgi:hypothetical protein
MKMFTISEQERNDIVEALLQASEYFADRQDADGDSEGFYPNEEMKLLMLCEAALEVLPGAGELV